MSRIQPTIQIFCDCGCNTQITDTSKMVTALIKDVPYDFLDWSHAVTAATAQQKVQGV